MASHTPPNDPTDPINHDDPESQPIDPLLSFTKPARLTSVDLLRGLTVFSMILVNTSSPSSFSFLQHTAWTGMTFADTIFPTFLFIVGVSIPLALNPERHLSGSDMRSWLTKTTRRILVRGVKLWCIGFVLLNLVPYIGMRWFFSPEEAFLRIPGVLQRIAVCYVVVALVHVQVLGRGDGAVEEMRGISRQILCASMIAFPSGLLVVYLILTYTLTGCTERDSFFDPPECSAEAYLDTIVFTRSHNFNLGAFDPEGTLSTLTSILTTYIGYFIGCDLRHYRRTAHDQHRLLTRLVYCLLLGASVLLLLAYFSSYLIPISKPLWTPSYVLAAGGISIIALSACIYLSDVRGYAFSSRVVRLLIAYGRNPILIYVLAEGIIVLMDLAYLWGQRNSPGGDGNGKLGEHEPDTVWMAVGDLVYSVAYTGVFAPLAWWLDHKRWYLRV